MKRARKKRVRRTAPGSVLEVTPLDEGNYRNGRQNESLALLNHTSGAKGRA